MLQRDVVSVAAVLLLLRVQCLHGSALPAVSSYEFTAYRMQQYNLAQQKHGCRGAIVVAEARSADEPVLTRRCIIMKVPDFTTEKYHEAQRQKAAAILILLPKNISSVPHDTVQSFMVTESEALRKGTLMPVYVVPEDEQLLFMYEEVKQAAATRTSSIFIRVLRSMVTATAFQILVSNNVPIKPIADTTLVTLEGVLPGTGEDTPTIVITAHYDSYGLAPVVSSRFPSVKVGLVHKKINLVESTVVWEHERYSLRRIPSFSLSHVEDPKSELRGSVLDTMPRVDFRKLKRNGVIIAEALARYMYNLSDKDFHDGRMSSLMAFLTSFPRATQLMDKEPSHIVQVNSLEHEFKRCLQQVHRHTFRQDRRVKPAAFDLFLGGCIAAYLGIVYYAILNFGYLYTKLKAAVKYKHQ
ncbi:Nicalin-1 [Nibea albiflora]|uniref:Nicalin-1 n=1 Tax=Nibea albiflora TaxID=240163 RepID=A0ACB7EYZ6_NIBAL|nr:Nicalin-1 [Nibea albiflora]